MTDTERDKEGHIICDICHTNPAKDVKGGTRTIEGKLVRGIWFCCEDCAKQIEDWRSYKPRRTTDDM